jgi:hypothetical protein
VTIETAILEQRVRSALRERGAARGRPSRSVGSARGANLGAVPASWPCSSGWRWPSPSHPS